MLLNDKKAPNDNLDQLCNISIPRQVFTALSVQEQLPNSGSKSKRPHKQTAVMTESLHREEKFSPKKKQKKKEPTSKDGKRQSKKGLAKKAEEASALRGGIEILNSLPTFQMNFPSRSKESTASQNSQLSLVRSSPNLSQLPSVNTTPQQSQLPAVLPSAQWPQQSQLSVVQFSALQQSELPLKSTPSSNQLPVHSVQPNQPIQSVLQNQLPVQSTPHPNQLSVPSAPPSNQLPAHSVQPNQPIQSVLQNQLPVQSTPHPNQLSVPSTPSSNQLPVHSVQPNQHIQSVLKNQLLVQSTPHPNQRSAQSNQLPLQSAIPPNQLLPPTPPSIRSSTPLQNDSESSLSSSLSSSSLQLQPSSSETRLTDTAETFCAALNVADDFLLLDDYPQVTSSRNDTIRKETVAHQVNDAASLQAIAALQEENNRLIKENEELREKVASICRYPGKFPNRDYCDVLLQYKLSQTLWTNI